MQSMAGEGRRAFLGHGTRTAELATVRPDGRPPVVPVWFWLDGDDRLFTVHGETVAARNLLRNRRAARCVDDESPPSAFVTVEGPVALSADPIELPAWATRIGARYLGEDQAAAGELLVRLSPVITVAQTGIADWERGKRGARMTTRSLSPV